MINQFDLNSIKRIIKTVKGFEKLPKNNIPNRRNNSGSNDYFYAIITEQNPSEKYKYAWKRLVVKDDKLSSAGDYEEGNYYDLPAIDALKSERVLVGDIVLLSPAYTQDSMVLHYTPTIKLAIAQEDIGRAVEGKFKVGDYDLLVVNKGIRIRKYEEVYIGYCDTTKKWLGESCQ